MEYQDIKIALEAAHIMADYFQESVYVMCDLAVKRGSERKPGDRVIEIISPREVWAA